jgi:putative two-component system response regulator
MERLNEIESETYAPVLVLTAQNDNETKIKALKSGAKDFLTKPFDQHEVLLRIGNMLEVRLLHNQQRDLNRMLDEKVKERTQELNDTRLEIIRRLGRAAEFRDNETGFHIIRMSKFSQMMALEAGLSEKMAELILNASPMHDIGKIGIPDRILLKPGKLDRDEWEIMKTHSAIGAEILSGHDSDLMNMAREIAMTHHEKWDGNGYPNNLRGEDIPMVGRIVAVADVFDALTSERPYKKAWPVDEAVAEINRSSGSHFDPELVDIFNKVLPQILDVRNQYQETEEDFAKLPDYVP